MNLNLLPQQLPSIIPASTANSSPASYFSPLKKSFISLLAVMELPRSLALEMISQQAWQTGGFLQVEGQIACVASCFIGHVRAVLVHGAGLHQDL